MSSHAKPNALTFIAAGAIGKGKAVTLAADGKTVTQCSSVTDKSIGICLNAPAAIGDRVEVALPGGGAKGLAGGTISAGDLLAPTTDGSLIATVTATNRWVAIAMEDMVSGDLGSVHVTLGLI